MMVTSFYFWLGREADDHEIRCAAARLALEWLRCDRVLRLVPKG
jgi:hypothetical protein